MKKTLYYLIIILLWMNSAVGFYLNEQFTFFWWLHFINVGITGGYLLNKLLTYLKD